MTRTESGNHSLHFITAWSAGLGFGGTSSAPGHVTRNSRPSHFVVFEGPPVPPPAQPNVALAHLPDLRAPPSRRTARARPAYAERAKIGGPSTRPSHSGDRIRRPPVRRGERS